MTRPQFTRAQEIERELSSLTHIIKRLQSDWPVQMDSKTAQWKIPAKHDVRNQLAEVLLAYQQTLEQEFNSL